MTHQELGELAQVFEIGAHSMTHRNLCELDDQGLEKEIAGSKRLLEDVIGHHVNMFCYPKGRHNAHVRRAVGKAGFVAARTTKMFSLTVSSHPFELATTFYARDYPWRSWPWHCVKTLNWAGFSQAMRVGVGRQWTVMAHSLFEHVHRHGGVWHLWGHAWEIDERGLWGELGALLGRVAGHEDVLYLTNGELLGVRQVARSAAPGAGRGVRTGAGLQDGAGP
jgi:hypothetical protein